MPQQNPAGILPAFSLDEILYVLSRHRYKVVTMTLLGAAAALLVYLAAPRIYRSEARLMVRYVADMSILGSEATGDRVIETSLRGQSIINSEAEIFSSHDLADRVAGDVGPTTIMAAAKGNSLLRRLGIHIPSFVKPAPSAGTGRDASLAGLLILKNLTIEVPSRSNIITLMYDAPDPALAQDVLRRLIDAYLKKHYEVHRGGDAYEFLAQQTDQLKARLQTTEGELRRLRQQAGVVSIEERKKSLPLSIDEVRRQLRDAELSLAVARAGSRPAVLAPRDAAANPSADEAGGKDAVTDAQSRLLATLASLRERERQLLITYTPDSTPVLNVREQIAELEKTIRQSYPGLLASEPALPATPVTSPGMLALVPGVPGLEAKVKTLKEQLQELQAEAERLDGLDTEILQLERKKQLEENNYLYFSRSLEQARIDDALSSSKLSNISIVQPATFPVLPLRSRLLHKVILLLGLGIFGGVGLAFGADRLLSRTVRDPSDLPERLSEPLLVSVPRVAGRGRFFFGVRAGWTFVIAGGEGAAEGRPRRTSWRIHDDQAVCFGRARDHLLETLRRAPGQPCLVGVAACGETTATGMAAAGLALALARDAGGKVLLADARLDESSLRLLLASRAHPAAIRRSGGRGGEPVALPGLDVFVAPRSAEAEKDAQSFAGGAVDVLPALIKDMRGSRYAFIVVELPSVGALGLGLRMAAELDGLVLVLEAEKSRVETGLCARDLLDEARANVSGVVLANRRVGGPPRPAA